MMRQLRTFLYDRRGISAVQDAVLFCVMVSIAGAILMPAFTSTIPRDTHVEKEREEKADEVLHQLMVCRVDKTAHLNAKPVLDALEDSTDMDITRGFLGPVVNGLLRREQRHLTYADLCTESVACQFKVLGKRINVLTYNCTNAVKKEIQAFLSNQLGDEYLYNFTVQWYPIPGFDFGGDFSVGHSRPPDADVYAASTYAVMPPSLFTGDIGFSISSIRRYIASNVEHAGNRYRNGTMSQEQLNSYLETVLLDVFNKTMWEGFDVDHDGDFDGPMETKSLVDIVLDYVFGEIRSALQLVFDESVRMVNDMIANGINRNFAVLSSEALTNSIAGISPTLDAGDTIDGMRDTITAHVKEALRQYVNQTFQHHIQTMAQDIVRHLDGPADIVTEILNCLFRHVDFRRARLSLSIWGA